MSYELKTNTAVRIPVGPLVDPTDGKTAEPALDVTALSVQIYQMKTDGNAVVRTQFAPTAADGNNDMALVTSSTDAMYDLELTAAQLNWLGNGRISFYDVDGFLVHYFDIHVVSANYFDNKYGATIEDVNAKTIENGIIVGDTLAASACTKIIDDFETQSQADPTGFHVNVLEIGGTGQTANDNGADINTLITGVNVASEDNIDFGATKKASITTAVPTAAAIKTAMEAGGSHLTLIKAVTDVESGVKAAVNALNDLSAADVMDTVDALLGGLNDLSAANVNAEVVDVLKTDTKGEPAQGAPGATLSIEDKIAWLYKFMRNLITNDGTFIKVWNDAGAVVDHKAPVSEAAGTVTRGEFVTGP